LNILIVNGSGAIGSSIIKGLNNESVNLIITSSTGEDVHGNKTVQCSFLIMKNSVPMMRKNGGNLLFFSSAASSIGMANHEAISAAKGGIEAMVRSSAATYAKNNIKVNAIAPGLVDSNLSKNIVSNEVALNVSKKMHSVGRIGTPDDISKFAIPLIVDNSSGALLNLENTKRALVVPNQRPPHIAVKRDNLESFGSPVKHRDGSESVYVKSPDNNTFELIRYPK